VLAHDAGAHRGACQHRREGLCEQRLAQQFARDRIAFPNLTVGIEYQHAARQTFDQRR